MAKADRKLPGRYTAKSHPRDCAIWTVKALKSCYCTNPNITSKSVYANIQAGMADISDIN